MIRPSYFYDLLIKNGTDFFAGVPDSLLKNLCAYITDNAPDSNHIISANEGSATGLATGYHLATGKIPFTLSRETKRERLLAALREAEEVANDPNAPTCTDPDKLEEFMLS